MVLRSGQRISLLQESLSILSFDGSRVVAVIQEYS